MKPLPKVFTKQKQVTKKEIYDCFIVNNQPQEVQIDVAYSKVGVNAPRIMIRKKRMVRLNLSHGDFFKLTPEGFKWLAEIEIDFKKTDSKK